MKAYKWRVQLQGGEVHIITVQTHSLMTALRRVRLDHPEWDIYDFAHFN